MKVWSDYKPNLKKKIEFTSIWNVEPQFSFNTKRISYIWGLLQLDTIINPDGNEFEYSYNYWHRDCSQISFYYWSLKDNIDDLRFTYGDDLCLDSMENAFGRHRNVSFQKTKKFLKSQTQQYHFIPASRGKQKRRWSIDRIETFQFCMP